MTRDKIKKEIEYEEAPSGNVTFYNYKEPLMKFESGFGFIGALVFDSESELVNQIFPHLIPHGRSTQYQSKGSTSRQSFVVHSDAKQSEKITK